MIRLLGWKAIGAVLVVCLAVAAAQAAQSGNITVPPQGSANWWGDPSGPDNTGFQIYNNEAEEKLASYEWDTTTTPGSLGTIPAGFVLLDGTLAITTNIPDGRMRLEVRMEIDRARARRQALREEKLTIMRLKRRENESVWRPIAQRIRARLGPGKARKIPSTADFMLGHYGVALADHYVWGVIDVPGVYAVGAPEPATLLCLAGGVALLLSNRRRRA